MKTQVLHTRVPKFLSEDENYLTLMIRVIPYWYGYMHSFPTPVNHR